MIHEEDSPNPIVLYIAFYSYLCNSYEARCTIHTDKLTIPTHVMGQQITPLNTNQHSKNDIVVSKTIVM